MKKYEEYHKIQSIFKRNKKTHKFIINEYSLPEFEYLKNNKWIIEEKFDGTNIRIIWDMVENKLEFRGRTDKAEIQQSLQHALKKLFTIEKFKEYFPKTDSYICLYGEGVGKGIQKSNKYCTNNNNSFILFDVKIGNWWLKRNSIEKIAFNLNIPVAPIINIGTIQDAIEIIKKGVKSTYGNFQAEGLVLKPLVGLNARNGKRIITKIKHGDI